jgi:hypothetical protein
LFLTGCKLSTFWQNNLELRKTLQKTVSRAKRNIAF